jgi:hypothetical protein
MRVADLAVKAINVTNNFGYQAGTPKELNRKLSSFMLTSLNSTFQLQLQITFTVVLVTCKRGSAKYSVKDDHAFLWKHAIFRHMPSRIPSTDQDEILQD